MLKDSLRSGYIRILLETESSRTAIRESSIYRRAIRRKTIGQLVPIVIFLPTSFLYCTRLFSRLSMSRARNYDTSYASIILCTAYIILLHIVCPCTHLLKLIVSLARPKDPQRPAKPPRSSASTPRDYEERRIAPCNVRVADRKTASRCYCWCARRSDCSPCCQR